MKNFVFTVLFGHNLDPLNHWNHINKFLRIVGFERLNERTIDDDDLSPLQPKAFYLISSEFLRECRGRLRFFIAIGSASLSASAIIDNRISVSAIWITAILKGCVGDYFVFFGCSLTVYLYLCKCKFWIVYLLSLKLYTVRDPLRWRWQGSHQIWQRNLPHE